jgi:hypothetical protein
MRHSCAITTAKRQLLGTPILSTSLVGLLFTVKPNVLALLTRIFAQFSPLILALASVLIYRVHEATERLVYSNRMNQLDLWYNFYYFFTFLRSIYPKFF